MNLTNVHVFFTAICFNFSFLAIIFEKIPNDEDFNTLKRLDGSGFITGLCALPEQPPTSTSSSAQPPLPPLPPPPPPSHPPPYTGTHLHLNVGWLFMVVCKRPLMNLPVSVLLAAYDL
ncbi:hypothetical protein OROGR_032717 [Orobanche gracilis]